MTTQGKWIAGVIVLVAIIAGVVYAGTVAKLNGIKITAVLGLTGPAEVNSLEIQRGLELAKVDLQERGVEVHITYENDQTDPKHTVSILQSLRGSRKPDAIIGLVWGFLVEAGGPLVHEAKIPTYSPANSSEFVEFESPYIFYGAVKNEQKIEPLVAWLTGRSISRVAIIVEQSGWGVNHEDIYRRAAEAAGTNIVLVESIPYGAETEVTPTIVSKLKASSAEVVIWTGSDEMALHLTKRMREQNVSLPIVGSVDLQTIINKGLIESVSGDDWWIFKTMANSKFAQIYADMYQEPPGLYADSAYDGLMILVEAIQNTDGSGEAVAEYLRNDTDHQGFATRYQFNDEGDIEGGEWQLVPVVNN